MAVRRHHNRTLIAAGGAALLALTVAGCGADASGAPAEKKAFPFSGKTLKIDAGNASVELTTGEVRDVEVTRQVDGWAFLGSGPRPVWKMSGDTLTLQVKCRALVSDCEARHRVTVPRGVAVTVDGDNGKVTAAGFDTALKLTTDNGAISVRDSSGPLVLRTDNGKITSDNTSGPSVAARTSNGAIRLALRTAPGTVEAVTDNGKIQIDLPAASAPYAVTAKSDNGKIDVSVPTSENSAHVVKARTDNGKITVRSAN
ncbi:DUF4097 domain-containing protein [Streptomyces sp. NPDC127033]|uniref:DUF4097 family beta strand repeat-containing protein n=1 Tax=Streptomyces sp. NPDC127033 TaxID=3347110 RepID=UPI00364750D8